MIPREEKHTLIEDGFDIWETFVMVERDVRKKTAQRQEIEA